MRLIIVCDEPSAARRLCSELSNCPAEAVCVTNLAELKDACEAPYELALINIAQSELIECLRTIREGPSGANCPVLVASERLPRGTELAGILPKLRAMPCIPGDLVKLARLLITGRREEWRRRNLCPL
jgi:DNA-binding response OmpR family regulator